VLFRSPDRSGYETAFEDDFSENTVADDARPDGIWFAPTWLTNIGREAEAARIGETPSAYVHDPAAKTLALRLCFADGRWRTGAFSSVNANGAGRSWTKGIFEIRAKFPKLAAPRPGFFPAFWAYGREHLFWRTRNRLETDFFEYDGLNGRWINATQHVHKPTVAYPRKGIVAEDRRFKIAGCEAAPQNGFGEAMDIYDGAWRTWSFQIEDDWTYCCIDGVEVSRTPTSPELLARKYLMVDWALEPAKGAPPPDPSRSYDMVIDFIRILQTRSDMAAKPEAFDRRPALSGRAAPGATLAVDPSVMASQISYAWHRNAKPILGATGPTLRLSPADAGARIRCLVCAVSLRDQPEAWTDALLVAAGP